MPLPNEEIAVRHNVTASRFETECAGRLAVCDYRLAGETMTFTHTLVPPGLRGRGIAERLVRVALAWAESERKKVVPACAYVAVFIDRHREFAGLPK